MTLRSKQPVKKKKADAILKRKIRRHIKEAWESEGEKKRKKHCNC